MIVRMSVSDNDFGAILSAYMKDYYSHVLCDLEPDESLSKSEQGQQAVEWLHANKKLKEVLRKTEDGKQIEAEDAEWLKERTKKSFAKFINKKEEDTQRYLNESLDISFPEYFQDKWENGEAFYWFQNSNTMISQ